MKIYLDTSALNRIFDDQSQARIYLESSSMLLILMYVDNQIVKLASSEALLFENIKNPYYERKIFVNSVIQKAAFFQEVNKNVLKRAQIIEKYRIKGLDSLHLACAEELKVDYFITCDDKILKRYKGKLKIKNPVELITSIIIGGDGNGKK